jgi:hypothetical protein
MFAKIATTTPSVDAPTITNPAIQSIATGISKIRKAGTNIDNTNKIGVPNIRKRNTVHNIINSV